MKEKLFFVLAAVFLSAMTSVAQECSIHTITGTYAYRGVGHSFMGGTPYPIDSPTDLTKGIVPLHTPGVFFAGSQVGSITIYPDYTVDSRSWAAMGPYRTDPAAPNIQAKITSIGLEETADGLVLGCGGTIQYPSFPGLPDMVDKFITWDNGNEIRLIHTSTATPATSTFVAKRVTRAFDAAPRCGTQTMVGKYVATCSASVVYMGPQSTAIAALMELDITGGEIKGNAFNRMENQTLVAHVSGQMTIEPDCTGKGFLNIPGLLPSGAKMLYSVVTYDNGKGAFLMPLQLELPNGAKTDYVSPMSCVLERAN